MRLPRRVQQQLDKTITPTTELGSSVASVEFSVCVASSPPSPLAPATGHGPFFWRLF